MLKLLNTRFPRDLANIIYNYTFFSGIVSDFNLVYTRDIASKQHQEHYSNSHIIQLLEYENKIIIGDNHGYIAIFENDKLIDVIHDENLSLYKIFILPNGDLITCTTSIYVHIYYPILKFWRKTNKMSKYEIFINAISNPIKYYQNYNENYKCIYTIYTNEIYPNNMLVINNNDTIFTDYYKKDIQVHRDNKLLYTISSNTEFSSILSLHNNNLVTGTSTGSVKIWKENICINTFDTMSKTKIIKISELQDKNLLILDKYGNIYIWGENKLVATLNHDGCYDIITLSNNDFITKSLQCFQIWKKKLNNYICIQEETGIILCLLNIKSFENDFISWANTYEYNELFGNGLNIWKYDKKMNIYKNSVIKHKKDDINNVFVMPFSNKLVIVYSNENMTILE